MNKRLIKERRHGSIFDVPVTDIRNFIQRWIVPIIGGLVSLTALYFLYGGLDFVQFFAILQQAKLGWVAVLGGAILLEQFVQGWKWRQLLYDLKPISSLRLMGAFLAGYGANALVPLGVSPLARSWLIARLENLKMATVLMTTAIARFIDGVVFAIFAGIVAMSGQTPRIEGNLQLGLGVAGALNLVLFGGLLWLLFSYQARLSNDTLLISRAIDWLAGRFGGQSGQFRAALSQGIIWPGQRPRQIAVVAASVAMKGLAAMHLLWAGLAVGVTLRFFDYLFMMVFAGFALVLARFIRAPGGFVIGAAFALKLLDVPDEQALAMILLTNITTMILVVGLGLIVLWRSGIDIRAASHRLETQNPEA